MPRLPPPWAKPARGLGCHRRQSQVGASALASTNRLIRFFQLDMIYAQFIAIDANFRLKLKNRQISDPELGSGWSYFVENSAYARHVEKNIDEEEARWVPNNM